MTPAALTQFPRTQRGALALATAPGLIAASAVVAFGGMAAAGSTANIPLGLGLLLVDGVVVVPLVLFLVYLPLAVAISKRLLPGGRPATERLLRVLGAGGVFGFLLGGSCGWVSLAGYGLLRVDWVGSWPVRILLVALIWAAVATISAVAIAETGLKATAPKRRRRPAAKRAATGAKSKTAPRKRALDNSGSTFMPETPGAEGA